MPATWTHDAVFYHIYPLGSCEAPERNDFISAPQPRLDALLPQLDRMQGMGINAVYLGPVFESSAHGYDTADYYRVDRRLGDNQLLAKVVSEMHARQMRVILDAVFYHVGRDFWAFRELREQGSSYGRRHWFKSIRFDQRSPYGDPFSYEGWAGCLDLVRLDLDQPEVQEHLLTAVGQWMDEYGIDGLRLDVAESLTPSFLRALASYTKSRRKDFWLMGEAVHGDYRRIANPEMIDAVTNYECYKSLWSSLNDRNYFEIAYALNRQFGPHGLYRDIELYNFADNHDVDRVASSLKQVRHLYPLYLLLFAMPGVPSIYYGSEWGLEGRKKDGDRCLRPRMPDGAGLSPDLAKAIGRLARLRAGSTALRSGNYEQVLVEADSFAFAREDRNEKIVVALNASDEVKTLELRLPNQQGVLVDLLNEGESFALEGGKVKLPMPSSWGRVMRLSC